MNKILDYVMIFIVVAIFGVLIMYFIYNICYCSVLTVNCFFKIIFKMCKVLCFFFCNFCCASNGPTLLLLREGARRCLGSDGSANIGEDGGNGNPFSGLSRIMESIRTS